MVIKRRRQYKVNNHKKAPKSKKVHCADRQKERGEIWGKDLGVSESIAQKFCWSKEWKINIAINSFFSLKICEGKSAVLSFKHVVV